MADPVDAVAAAADALAAAVEGAGDSPVSTDGMKKRALELLTEDGGGNDDEFDLDATTLDDVMVSPMLKKQRVEVGEGTNSAEEEEEGDEAEENGGGEEEDPLLQDEDGGFSGLDDDDALAPPDASTDEEAGRTGNGGDVVNIDDGEDDSEEEEEQVNGGEETLDEEDEEEEEEEEEDDDEEEETEELLTPLQRWRMEQNKLVARQLIPRLNSSARSKLVMTALEKYGEELFEGHETARDAILVDACAKDSMLDVIKEAVRRSEESLGGTENAPLEVDDDDDEFDDYNEGDDEEDDEGDRHAERGSVDEDSEPQGEINLLSDEETDDNGAGATRTDEDEDEDDDDEEEDPDTGGELTVESASGGEESFDEL